MKFINPQNVVSQMGLKNGFTVADLGAGAGFFSIAAANIVGNTGVVYAVDVQQSKLTAVSSSASQQGLKNIQIIQADLEQAVKAIPDASCDAVMMASVIHEVKSRTMLLQNAYRILKTGGVVLAVDWKAEHTLFGPSLERRIPEQQLEEELHNLGFKKLKSIPADQFHYAMLLQK